MRCEEDRAESPRSILNSQYPCGHAISSLLSTVPTFRLSLSASLPLLRDSVCPSFTLDTHKRRKRIPVGVFVKARARELKKMEATQNPHPYVPRDLKLPGYVPILLSQLTIIGVYGIASVLVVAFIWFISGRSAKRSTVDRVLMCWWAFTGLTHMILEGYFVFSPEFYKDKSAFYLSEVWKEYSKGDSRYAGRDSAIVTVEGLTAVLEGPASLLAVYAIAKGKPYSYILQFAISLGQLYGTAVYFITALLEGDNFAASPLYYYAYYVVMNSFWIVIPTAIAIRCWKKICAALNNQGQKKAKTR